MLFWIVSLGLTVAIGAALFHALGRGGRARAVNADLSVYRDQLSGLDRDLARGVIDKDEAARARIEISRRILEIDRADPNASDVQGSVLLPGLLLGAALVGAFGLYDYLGAPGYPDLPMADRLAAARSLHSDPEERPSQATAEAGATLPDRPAPDTQYLELMKRLRKAVAANPGELTGQRLLARNEAALGNYADAGAAQREVIALAASDATATDYATLADIYVLATAGYVSPEAEAALTEALKLDPKNGTARYYMGLMWAQTGRPDRAFGLWRGLLEEGPEAAPWTAAIRAQIGFLARAAGVDYTPPAAAPGPDTADIAAASEMTPEERQEMIRGMVEGLADRLASDGGTSEEWARLIFALAQLGEVERAKAIWGEAQAVFAGREAELATVRAAAEQAGIVE